MDVTTTVSSFKKTLRTGERLVKRTSEPVWRYGFNAGPTRDFRRHPPALGDEARRVLADLDRDGLALSTLADLTGDPDLLGRLQAEAARLEEARAVDLERRRQRIATADVGGPKDKEFVIELLDSRRPVIDPKGLLAQTALNDQLRGVADAYFGMRTRVSDINFWRNLPTPLPPRSSQLWHRDLPEDYFILKLFVYLEDCYEGNGPFTYLVGTHGKGDRRLQLPAQDDGQTMRSTDDALAQAGVLDRMRVCTGKAGSVVFADTVGYHKGGWVQEKGRLLFHVLYSSRAAHPNRMLGLPHGVRRSDWADDLVFDRHAVGRPEVPEPASLN
ncbi:MAG TPA: phytanoyl-CoA dioxygenase family protein [Actinomycetes bacterium]|nr:phytanoyl-CoA dioxygenase family protein [Actinomycetes bacterium]